MGFNRNEDCGSYVIIHQPFGQGSYTKSKISEKNIYRHDKETDREYEFSNTYNKREVVMKYNKNIYSLNQAKNNFYNVLQFKYYCKE